MGKGKGNGWEIIWESWDGTLMGDYLGEGEENFGGIIWGNSSREGRVGVIKPRMIETKKR